MAYKITAYTKSQAKKTWGRSKAFFSERKEGCSFQERGQGCRCWGYWL